MAAPMLGRGLVRFGIIIAVFALLYGAVYISPFTSENRAYLLRLLYMSTVQCFLLLGANYLWRIVTSVLDVGTSSQSESESKIFGHSDTSSVGRFAAKCIFLCFIVIANLSYLSNYIIGTKPNLFQHICYACLGFFVQICLCLLLIDGLVLTVGIIQFLRQFLHNALHQDVQYGAFSPRKSRLKFIKLSLAVIYSLSIGLYGLYAASQPPVVKHLEVRIPGLAKSMDNLKVVQVSDIHIGPTVSKDKLERIAKIVNTLDPDVVAFVGDLVDGTVDSLADTIHPVTNIKTKLGKYFVTGNHEYYTAEVDLWMAHLEKLGIHSLHNSHSKVYSPTNDVDFLWIAGIDDLHADNIKYEGHGIDLKSALGDCDKEHPVILLAHRPEAARIALNSQYKDKIKLVLCGHTHGGQFFPFTIAAYLFNPFVYGLYEYRNSLVYVSQGTAYWGIPMRFATTMEVTEIILRA